MSERSPDGGVPGDHRPDDPLAALMTDLADGRFPPPDGTIRLVPPDVTTGLSAVLSFTACVVAATTCTLGDLEAWGIDAYGGAHHPRVLLGMAGEGGWVGVLDSVLVARGTGRSPSTRLVPADELPGLERVGYATALRRDVGVLVDERGVVTLGRGLGGRLELGFEVVEGERSRGHGRGLLVAALDAVADGEPVFASCAPGNVRSLRALAAAGFVAVGSEVLVRPAPAHNAAPLAAADGDGVV